MTGPTAIDPERVRAFGAKMLGIYSGGMLSLLVDLGNRTGLFDAAAQGASTSRELADRTGLEEGYVREWLGGMTTGGIFTYDADTSSYCLPPEHAVVLTGATLRNAAPMSRVVTLLAGHVLGVADCFRRGGGVPHEAYRPEFTERGGVGPVEVLDDEKQRLPVGDLEDDGLKGGEQAHAPVGCRAGRGVALQRDAEQVAEEGDGLGWVEVVLGEPALQHATLLLGQGAGVEAEDDALEEVDDGVERALPVVGGALHRRQPRGRVSRGDCEVVLV